MYTELHCHSYFSLLDGASSPEALVSTAKALGYTALALTDHNSLAGAARFWKAAQQAKIHPIFGAEVTLENGHHLTLLAETQQGYGHLCRLLTECRRAPVVQDKDMPLTSAPAAASPGTEVDDWAGKIEPKLSWELLARYNKGLIALSGCRMGPVAAPLLTDKPMSVKMGEAKAAAARLLTLFGKDHFYIELQNHGLPGDKALCNQLMEIAWSLNLLPVVTNNVHYAKPENSRLRDALIAISHNQSLQATAQAGLLPWNSRYHLAEPAEMVRRFQFQPDAVTRSNEIAHRCQVSLDFSTQRLPQFPTPEELTEFEYLYRLCHKNLPKRYAQLTPTILKQLTHELDIIERAGLAGYFLIVWDLVRFAREEGIRCQGRGSAANSIVAYLLTITSIDPLAHNLLFERFLSEDKFTTPDIDIDFAADRREEVIQYVYQRYGHNHAAMVCNIVTYRARSAIRDLGKALGFPPPVLERLSRSLDTNSPKEAATWLENKVSERAEENEEEKEKEKAEVTLSPSHPPTLSPCHPVTSSSPHPLTLLADLMRQIDGCPRHLSIHSGGMVITAPPLFSLVPLEPATMPGRLVMQWDKDSVEDAGLIKIDLLGLRTLGLVTEALAYVNAAYANSGNSDQPLLDIDAVSLDDPLIYDMLQKGDSIGAFQVESRAQQQMLPRLKPTCFEDIAVQVAIVRPGPIQGGAVHPYLRRRAGLEPVSYLHSSLKSVLEDTLGVLLFQEQAIRISMVAAGFSPSQADMLRRAMSRSHHAEAMDLMRARFLNGAQKEGVDDETAAAIFDQLVGFAGYGFCKSHAASFALLAYQTMYLKRYHPAAFTCALLNQQPMGFYSTEVIVGDAKRHGVEILPLDVHASNWHYQLEEQTEKATRRRVALRTGFCALTGIGQQGWECIQRARSERPFQDLRDFCRRTQLAESTMSAIIRAGGLDAFGERRKLLWQLPPLCHQEGGLDLDVPIINVTLPTLEALEETVWSYELVGYAPDVQIMEHFRTHLKAQGVLSTWQVKQAKPGQRVQVAGLVAIRQRPRTANGITFISLEDESGLLDLVLKVERYAALREAFQRNGLVVAAGEVQRSGRAVSVLVQNALPITV